MSLLGNPSSLDLPHPSILLSTAGGLAHDDLVHPQNGQGGIDRQTEGIGLGIEQIANGRGVVDAVPSGPRRLDVDAGHGVAVGMRRAQGGQDGAAVQPGVLGQGPGDDLQGPGEGADGVLVEAGAGVGVVPDLDAEVHLGGAGSGDEAAVAAGHLGGVDAVVDGALQVGQGRAGGGPEEDGGEAASPLTSPAGLVLAEDGDLPAADLLDLDCGELPEALANAGLISIASSSSSGGGPITLTEATDTSWPGSWFACKLGFKFACGTPSCLLPGGSPIPGPGDSCIDWLQTDGCGQCGYYACREAQSQCGPDGYLEGYVGRYCNKFSSVTESGLSPAGQAWMADVRECLVETLDAQTDANTPCDEIESIGIDSHALCYTQEGFCDLPLTDWFSIVHTVDPGDVPLKQILATGHLCLQDWFTP